MRRNDQAVPTKTYKNKAVYIWNKSEKKLTERCTQ